MNLIDLLQKSSLFTGCSAEQLVKMSAAGETHPIPRGETIFEQGTPEREVFVLLGGRVQITVALSRKTEQAPVHTVVPGEVFGEFSIVADDPRRASAVAMQDSELFVLSRDVFLGMAEEDHHLGYIVMRNLAAILVARITKTTEELRASLMF